MMGVGKSTVGKSLADKLSFKFRDIDKIIEIKEGCTIDIIFKNKGENYFRSLEKKITLSELRKENIVISLGGGAFLNNSIRRTVKDSSISFWIDVKTDILINRLKKNKKRPLLFKKNLIETVKKIYLERKKIYSQSDFKIKSDFLKTDKIVEQILKVYEKTNN